MRKLILFLSLVFFISNLNAQENYRCEFADTIISVIPDSLFRALAFKNNFSEEQIEQILHKQRMNPARSYYYKIVRAGKDRTIIRVDKSSIHGNLTVENFDSLLYINDEIFTDSSSVNGFSDNPSNLPKKFFRGTGKKITILDYQCNEYISTDSNCYIWVTEELPEYINPGVRTNNVKGAVLGFELKRTETITRSMLVKLEKKL